MCLSVKCSTGQESQFLKFSSLRNFRPSLEHFTGECHASQIVTRTTPPLPTTCKRLCHHPSASFSHTLHWDVVRYCTERQWKLGRSPQGKMAVEMYYESFQIDGIQSRTKYQVERTTAWKRMQGCGAGLCFLGTLRRCLLWFFSIWCRFQLLSALIFLLFHSGHILVSLHLPIGSSQGDRTMFCLTWVSFFQCTLCHFLFFLPITDLRSRYPAFCHILSNVLHILRLPGYGGHWVLVRTMAYQSVTSGLLLIDCPNPEDMFTSQ